MADPSDITQTGFSAEPEEIKQNDEDNCIDLI